MCYVVALQGVYTYSPETVDKDLPRNTIPV
jgi:hypothetical protein